MSEHTAGPWTTEELQELTTGGERRPATYISASKGWASPKRTVAIVGHWTDRPNPEVDARLIAAAPELLEACRALIEEREAEWGANTPAYVMGEKAIAKAEGRAL